MPQWLGIDETRKRKEIEIVMKKNNPFSAFGTEQALIGGLIINPITFHDVNEIVDIDDFYNIDHRRIFKAIKKLIDDGMDVDVVAISDIVEVEKQGIFSYVTDLATNCAGSSNVFFYAKIIRDKAQKREVIWSANQIIKYTNEMTDATSEDVISFANSCFSKIDNRSSSGFELVAMDSALKSFVNDLEERFNSDDDKLNGLSSGLPDIDLLTNGLKPGHLIILGGRPSMGKSTLALQMAFNASERDSANGIFFSLEMPNNDLMQKLIACAGHVNLRDLENPKQANDEFWNVLANAAGRVKNVKLKTMYCHGAHINQIIANARKAHRVEPLDYIVIDHIHFLDSDGDTNERELSKITKSLKALAGQLNIPVIALAQLNRGLEKRHDKRPVISDLRGSGSIEEDADLIFFVYRDDYYNDDEYNPNKGLIQLELAKHRNGKIGKAFFEHRLDQSRVEPTKRVLHFTDKKNGYHHDL